MDVLSTARNYVAAGISVIPVKADGSKSPLLGGWREYSDRLPTDAELVKWFGGAKLVGIGVACGPASGNLIVMDFENDGTISAYLEWLQRLPEDLKALALSLPTVITPSGGRHIWIRLENSQPGGKLARYESGKTKIELRGQGHQVLAPGCPAECHRTGKLYEWADETSFEPITAELFLLLCEYAGSCNDYLAPEQPRDTSAVAGTPAGIDSPGNDFNRRGTWEETGLMAAGWSWSRQLDGDRGFLTRPGKDTGISASVGMVSSRANGYPYLYVWSTSTDFATETPFSRFYVYAFLNHKGDFSAAAQELYRLGYGERYSGPEIETTAENLVDLSGLVMRLNTPNGIPFSPFTKPKAAIVDESKPFKWMSELSGEADSTKWLWKGYIPKGGITLFSAIWKVGKSTLLSHLLKSLDGSQSEFLGQEITPSRVLYLSEEDERIWSGRRDDLLIGDHVGMWCRPFTQRPTTADWRRVIDEVVKQVERHQFDLVILDTLSKMWPVREENDAGQVEEALMPLWKITTQGTAVLLVHHMRKSDGTQFLGSRGSGGLPSFCEVLMEFRRDSETNMKDRKRVITATGRYNDIPEKLLIELECGRYISHGDPGDSDVRAAVKMFPWSEVALQIIQEAGSAGIEIKPLKAAIKDRRGKSCNNEDLDSWARKKEEDGEIIITGKGVKGDPFVYMTPTLPILTP